MPDAVVLLSGGLDSATTLGIAMAQGYRPNVMTFRYGQRHDVEIEAARRVVAAMGVTKHVIVEIDLRLFGKSALTNAIDVPKHRSDAAMNDGIPATYVPARNTVFLSFALAWAESLDAFDIFIGVNALDYTGYPDCRPEYISAYEQMARLATVAGISGIPLNIHTPLIDLTKGQIIQLGTQLGVDYSLTSSCYDPQPGPTACGHCDSCLLRLKGFSDAGLKDPIAYVGR